jgi:hypothetical protein
LFDDDDFKAEYMKHFRSMLQVVCDGEPELMITPHYELFIESEVEKFEEKVNGHIRDFNKRVIEYYSDQKSHQDQAEEEIRSIFKDFANNGDVFGYFPLLEFQRHDIAFLDLRLRSRFAKLLVLMNPSDLSETEEANHVVRIHELK